MRAGTTGLKATRELDAVSGQRRFRPYPAYKDSDIEWLGEIPAHWEVKPFKALLSRNDSGVWGDDFADDGVIVLRSTDQTVDGNWKIDNPARRRLTAREASEARLVVGDLVVTKSSGSELHIGKTSIVDESVAALKSCFSNFMQRLRVALPNEGRYFWYLLNCPVAREQFVFLSSTTTGLGNLNGSILGAIRVPGASVSEQYTIAAFLDRETTRIDDLVRKKERLIELLQEKRNAIIAQAIPENPGINEVRLGYYVDLLPGYAFSSPEFSYDPEDIRLLRGVNVSTGTTRWDDVVYWPRSDIERFRAYQLRERDIVFGMDRPWVGGGIRVAEISKEDLPSLLLQRVARLRAKRGLAQSYLKLILSSPQFLAHFEPILTGISVPHVSPDQILSFRVRLTEIHVQEATCSHVQSQTERFDSMCEVLQASINRLRDFRTAFISAAVTGKIDLREEAA